VKGILQVRQVNISLLKDIEGYSGLNRQPM